MSGVEQQRRYGAALSGRYPDAVIVFRLPDSTVLALDLFAGICERRGGGAVTRQRQPGDAFDLLAMPGTVYAAVRSALLAERWEICEVAPADVAQDWGCRRVRAEATL